MRTKSPQARSFTMMMKNERRRQRRAEERTFAETVRAAIIKARRRK